MTVATLIGILQLVEDKDINVILPIDGGFLTVCATESGVGIDNDNEEIFAIMPCFCHMKEDEPIKLDVKASDSDLNDN